jgi:hypothetical protein
MVYRIWHFVAESQCEEFGAKLNILEQVWQVEAEVELSKALEEFVEAIGG